MQKPTSAANDAANGAQHLNGGFAGLGGEAPSVRSGSGFWAAGRATLSSNVFTAFGRCAREPARGVTHWRAATATGMISAEWERRSIVRVCRHDNIKNTHRKDSMCRTVSK